MLGLKTNQNIQCTIRELMNYFGEVFWVFLDTYTKCSKDLFSSITRLMVLILCQKTLLIMED